MTTKRDHNTIDATAMALRLSRRQFARRAAQTFVALGIQPIAVTALAQSLCAPTNLRIQSGETVTGGTSGGTTGGCGGTSSGVSGTFPTASTTGVPAGVTLASSGSLTINTAGTVIDAKNIQGSVTINASNVTIKRCRIRGSAFSLVWIKSGVTGVRVEDCEIDGLGTSGSGNSMGVMGPATVLRCNIYGVENGVTPYSDSLVEANYIHHLAAPGSPHYDGIQIDGGISNVTIRNNMIDMTEHGQTATVMIDNYFGPISNISVTGNRLLGGGYTVYSDGQFSGGSISGVSFTFNRMKRGYWGYSSIVNNKPVWSGNVDDVTGAAI